MPPRAAGALAGTVFALLLFAPAVLVRVGWEHLVWEDDYALLATQVAERSDASRRTGYDAEKIAFVERVLELIGPDELVLNLPYDGSVYAYGVSGLNVYWRYMAGYDEKSESELPGSRLLRRELDGAVDGERADVLSVLEETGAEYLLVLTRDQEEMAESYVPYRPRDWRGVQPLGDDTPGLEVVLAEGDMRLYPDRPERVGVGALPAVGGFSPQVVRFWLYSCQATIKSYRCGGCPALRVRRAWRGRWEWHWSFGWRAFCIAPAASSPSAEKSSCSLARPRGRSTLPCSCPSSHDASLTAGSYGAASPRSAG